MKENKAIYFSHDTNASNDPKIRDLRVNYGWSAVGIYWAIIETMHKEKNGEISKELLKTIILDFCYQDKEEADKIEKGLYATALLRLSKGIASSKRVNENLSDINEKSDIGRRNAMKRWTNTSEENTTALQTKCKPNAIKEKKVKESKVNNNIIEREEDKSSPSQTSKQFFDNQDEQERIIGLLEAKGYNQPIIVREITKFISYWTEPNKSGSKQRWQMEKTFEIGRRLATWFSRVKEFSGQSNKGKEIIF